MRFIAFIVLFMFAAPVLAAESPIMTGDPGTPSAAQELAPPVQLDAPAVPAEILNATNTETIPEGLRYIIATPEETSRAYGKLVQALAETPHDFRSLMPVDGETTTYAGIFMALHGLGGQEEKVKLLNTVTYKIPFSDAVTKEVKGYGAKTPQQLEMLAAAYMETVKIQPGYKVRKLTPEEMKIIWYSTARDLYEPIFVVEDAAHRYVFDMNNSGEYLEFFEDLGKPCFPAMGEGETRMPCKCVGTTNDGIKYTVVFQGCLTKE